MFSSPPTSPTTPIRPSAETSDSTDPHFTTPRRRKTPRINNTKTASKKIFGYTPQDWQVKVTLKILEGHDMIVLAGTGAGKSLVFTMVAIAAALVGFKGVVMVICPLKAPQLDQVRRINELREKATESDTGLPKIRAVAINEDNNDDEAFKELDTDETCLCYAAPECLLRNNTFKKQF
ncbi:hypothetical protein PILCRDRAFT_17396 [Piloderma croceum F 1598]|uniref:DEAD/DEAH-box helicase domain-containing protein n=1 Tax=Piloderma croceum (strain F 1598) TaxID=765440 RepID=A0A0C3ETH7_PILCF|nr:hypothetical protein PILCRDRAFT_17396 [Piloderma croceum F 1598]